MARRRAAVRPALGLLVVGLGLIGGAARNARAQLAITELMSSASTNCAGTQTTHPDFWELTNFGTNIIDLSGYGFWDAPLPGIARRVADGVHIDPGESIVFVRIEIPPLDRTAFCAWWGLTPCPQILFYDNLGFSSRGEELWLWDSLDNLVDHVTFGPAREDQGITFTYDPGCGLFGELSEVGACGVFRAAGCDDIGSPGRAPCGPVPLAILQQPAGQTVDAGGTVVFSAGVCGLPRPRMQWFFNGVPQGSGVGVGETIPVVVNYAGSGLAWKTGAKPTDVVIAAVGPADAGQYFAVFDNGLERMTSAVVTLTVNTNPAPPRIESPPPEQRWPAVNGYPTTNLVVAPGQTAELAVLAGGYPAPSFQWSWSPDGARFVELAGETNSTLTIAPADATHAGIYRVRVENTRGSTNAAAALQVKPKPALKITEAMGLPNLVADHADWWELTNLGAEAVALYGYRWDDWPGSIGSGPTITNQVTLEPGESVVFSKGLSPEAFRQWWGADNLPPHLKIIWYTANSLSQFGDEINVWNPTASLDSDWIDSVGFSTLLLGVSFWFLPADPCSVFGAPSFIGECGAFGAAQGGDVGSPGWTDWTPPCLTRIRCDAAVVSLEWKAQPGSTNRVQYTDRLAAPSSATVWTDLGTYSFTHATGVATDVTRELDQRRFYRLERVAPNHCPCRE